MPLPMVTIMASGKSVAGKLRCVKEFLVIPAPGMPLLDVCSFSFTRCMWLCLYLMYVALPLLDVCSFSLQSAFTVIET